jgi:hypothetical protein
LKQGKLQAASSALIINTHTHARACNI